VRKVSIAIFRRERLLPVFAVTLVAMICLQFFVPADVEAWMPGVPHPIQGEVWNSDGTNPADGEITFQAYVIGREGELQTELEPATNFCADGFYGFDVGSFYTAWAEGDVVEVSVVNTANGECSKMQIPMGPENPEDEFPNYCMREAFLCSKGDVSGDGPVNVIDVQGTINQALGVSPETCEADANFDDSVNVIDVQAVINCALGVDCSFTSCQ